MHPTPEFLAELDQHFRNRVCNVPNLDAPVLVIFDYSPNAGTPPVSLAFDLSGGAKCWITATEIEKINNNGPNPHAKYRRFCLDGYSFHPYSVQSFGTTIFTDVESISSVCQSLYEHLRRGLANHA